MHEIPADTAARLRQQGLTDSDLDELRRTGMFHRGGDAPLTVAFQNGWVTVVSGSTESTADLEAMQKDAIAKAELALGMDLDGDGVVGDPEHGAPAPAAGAPFGMAFQLGGSSASMRLGGTTAITTAVTRGQLASDAAPPSAVQMTGPAGAGGPFVSGDGAPKRGWTTTRLLLAFVAIDIVIGGTALAIWWYSSR